MQAINHIATALILKRAVPRAPLFGLIIAVEAVEYLWVVLNLIGIERTLIADNMRSVADVHLVHMPFSHSIVSSLILGLLVGAFILWRGGRAAFAVAVALTLAVMSHIVLDLLVHAQDIEIAPHLGAGKYGTGLYAHLPLGALALETLWGLACWWMYRGSWKLLGVFVLAGLASIPFYSVMINTGEIALAGQSTMFALMILAQMLIMSGLVWLLAREPRSEQ